MPHGTSPEKHVRGRSFGRQRRTGVRRGTSERSGVSPPIRDGGPPQQNKRIAAAVASADRRSVRLGFSAGRVEPSRKEDRPISGEWQNCLIVPDGSVAILQLDKQKTGTVPILLDRGSLRANGIAVPASGEKRLIVWISPRIVVPEEEETLLSTGVSP